MSEGDGDYEEAQLVEQGTEEVLIPAIKGMGETLQKVSQSVGTGARKIAGDVEEVDGASGGDPQPGRRRRTAPSRTRRGRSHREDDDRGRKHRRAVHR